MERHWDAASQGETSAAGSVRSRQSFCDYLVGARKQRGMSIHDIATVTRIPVRSIERLESGLFEELPADVFVRGFLRSYARCVGLSAEETIRRYADCGMTPAPVSTALAVAPAGEPASAMDAGDAPDVGHGHGHGPGHTSGSASPSPRSSRSMDAERVQDAHAEQAAVAATDSAACTEHAVEHASETRRAPTTSDVVDADERQSKRKRKRRKRKQQRDVMAASAAPARDAASGGGHPASAPISTAPARELSQAQSAAGSESASPALARDEAGPAQPGPAAAEDVAPVLPAAAPGPAVSSAAERPDGRAATAVTASNGAAQPLAADTGSQPLAARVHAQSSRSQPARRSRAATVTTRAMPVLVIDDEHPEDAERSQEERVGRGEASWRSFLPPALLDSDDGSHRGTLTLAVIILVIVATLTMSYLLRRPNVSGDGVTWQVPAHGEMSRPRGHA